MVDRYRSIHQKQLARLIVSIMEAPNVETARVLLGGSEKELMMLLEIMLHRQPFLEDDSRFPSLKAALWSDMMSLAQKVLGDEESLYFERASELLAEPVRKTAPDQSQIWSEYNKALPLLAVCTLGLSWPGAQRETLMALCRDLYDVAARFRTLADAGRPPAPPPVEDDDTAPAEEDDLAWLDALEDGPCG